MTRLGRSEYAARYGPTIGDRVRLGDTNLVLQIEADDNRPGDEVVGGWGKTFRNGMGIQLDAARESELDVVITNVIVMDPVLGIRKGNIGIKDGRITGVGRAGNPDVTDGILLPLGPGTIAIPGEGLIATPGGVDSHVHLRTPRMLPAALTSGMTTLIVGGTGQNPAFNLHQSIRSLEHVPVNVGLLGRAAGSGSMERQIEDGACGLKVHEDYAAYPTVIDAALSVADAYDVAVAIHTDGMNESGGLGDTLAAIAGRVVHAYHVEGSGGGHSDSLALAAHDHVIGSSTTPTIPFGPNAVADVTAMMWSVHGMNSAVPSDRARVERRVREATIHAENHLHELGAISITNSDSQAMGRMGEVIRRTWQLAHRMKAGAGPTPDHDNARILRYLAKYTVNPARTHGIADHVGSLETGRLADVVLWHPAFFGAKPEMVIKSGFPVWGLTGDGNASVTRCEPTYYGPLTGGVGTSPASLSGLFVSDAASSTVRSATDTQRQVMAVANTRSIRKRDMVHNDASPSVDVPDEGDVLVDGSPVPTLPDAELPLNRRYFLF